MAKLFSFSYVPPPTQRYMVYCYKVIDLDDNNGVASVDLPGYKEMTWIPDLLPRPSATVPPPTEAFILFYCLRLARSL